MTADVAPCRDPAEQLRRGHGFGELIVEIGAARAQAIDLLTEAGQGDDQVGGAPWRLADALSELRIHHHAVADHEKRRFDSGSLERAEQLGQEGEDLIAHRRDRRQHARQAERLERAIDFEALDSQPVDLIFLLLATQFRSYAQPLIILSNVVFAFIGERPWLA